MEKNHAQAHIFYELVRAYICKFTKGRFSARRQKGEQCKMLIQDNFYNPGVQ